MLCVYLCPWSWNYSICIRDSSNVYIPERKSHLSMPMFICSCNECHVYAMFITYVWLYRKKSRLQSECLDRKCSYLQRCPTWTKADIVTADISCNRFWLLLTKFPICSICKICIEKKLPIRPAGRSLSVPRLKRRKASAHFLIVNWIFVQFAKLPKIYWKRPLPIDRFNSRIYWNIKMSFSC